MGVARFAIKMDPSPRRIGRALGEIGQGLADFRPVFRALLPLMVRGLVQNFEERGAPIGEKWADLSPSWAKRKASRGLSAQLLVARGTMLGELQSDGKMKRSITSRQLVVGPSKSLPYIHHFGAKRGNLPARRFIAWSPSMRDIARAHMEEYRDRLLAEASSRMRAAGGGA